MDTKDSAGGSASDGGPAVACRAEGRDVIVVIPALNEAPHIAACLRSLMKGDVRLGAVDFVVADGGSSDGTRAVVLALQSEFPNLRMVDNPRKLQSAAVNLAARAAGPERRILVRCDAHAAYPPNYIMAVADALLSRGVASIVTPMDAQGETCFQRAVAWIVDTPLGSGGSAHRGGRKSMFVDHGHHAGFNLASFLSIGGYDESFSHNEDAEFDTRLRKAGGAIFLDASIRMTYFPRRTLRALARQYFNYGKGRRRTLLKHGEPLRVRQMVPLATLAACLAGIVIAPLAPVGLILPGGYAAVLLCASLAVAVRRGSVCGLLAGPASATIHMSWSAGFLRQMLREARF